MSKELTYINDFPPLQTGVDMIAQERHRQINEEGWTLERDKHINQNQELAMAAAVYALPASRRYMANWPWQRGTYKATPEDRIRELVKSGALVAAEIDRLLGRI